MVLLRKEVLWRLVEPEPHEHRGDDEEGAANPDHEVLSGVRIHGHSVSRDSPNHKIGVRAARARGRRRVLPNPRNGPEASPALRCRVRRVLRNLSFSIILAGLALLFLEGTLRALGIPDPGLYAGDLAGIWTLRADLPLRRVPFRERGTDFGVRTNHLGYRGGPPADGGLLCLGDSTTFGWGVEENETWPARLGAALGIPVINGGVPGYTTVQALATIDAALATHPQHVLLGYLVRDAERSVATDRVRASAPHAQPPDLALLRLLRALRPAPRAPVGTVPRVPPAEFQANLIELVARIRASSADVKLLAFPMVIPAPAHLAAMAAVPDVGLLAPSLPPDQFFAEDPIHLTPDGNAQLAAVLAAELSSWR